jgi:hypothetical protein
MRASASFLAAMHGWESVPTMNVAVIRIGDAARALSAEDWKYSVLQGPRRPHINHDLAPAGVAAWDRHDSS